MFTIPMFAAYCALIAGSVPCLSPAYQAAYYYQPPILSAGAQYTAPLNFPRVAQVGPSIHTR